MQAPPPAVAHSKQFLVRHVSSVKCREAAISGHRSRGDIEATLAIAAPVEANASVVLHLSSYVPVSTYHALAIAAGQAESPIRRRPPRKEVTLQM